MADTADMNSSLIKFACLALLALALAGCGTTPLGTRAIEEDYLGMGHAQAMYRYGQTLLAQGRYREALTAFSSAEQTAYTDALREAARVRRMWVEEAIQAYEKGQTPPAPPVLTPPSPPEPLRPQAGEPFGDPSGKEGYSGSTVREQPLGEPGQPVPPDWQELRPSTLPPPYEHPEQFQNPPGSNAASGS